tara:strand:+ start:977 stop:2968 length:1992 start_codon:yes stop_codon:yes gene_type:complete
MGFKYIVLIIGVLFFTLLSCKHEIEDPNWTVNLVAPIAKTELTLTDLLSDSIITIDTLNDESLLLVYMLDGIDTNLNHLVDDGGLEFEYSDNIMISSFEIPDVSLDFEASLGRLIKNTSLASLLINGSTPTQPIPQITIPAKEFDLAEITKFNEIEIESAIIDIKVINNLPTSINELTFTLKNQDPSSQIIAVPSTGVPISLNQGQSITLSDNLDNILVTNLLELSISNFNFLPNFNPNIIDTSTGIKFEILIHDIIVNRISGIIEEPITLESVSDELYIDIEGINMKRARVDYGSLDIKLETVLDAPIQINFYSPNIIPDDTIIISLNAGSTSYSIDLSGKDILFKGEYNDTINSFYYEMHGFVLPSSIDYDVSLSNNLGYEISTSIIPKYIIGDIIDIKMQIEKDSFDFDFFSELETGNNFEIENASINFEIENSVGVGCDLDLNLYSINTQEQTSVNMNYPVSVNSATFNEYTAIVTPNYFTVPLDIADVINIKPNQLSIDGEVILKPGLDKFIVYDNGISLNPSIEIPLSFIASDLILSDTAEVDIPSDIEGITLKLIIDNGYPINTNLTINLLDTNGVILDSKIHSIPAGITNSSGRVYEPTRSILKINIDSEDIELIKNIHYLASFETSSQTEYNKIYSDYSIDAQIIVEYERIIGE